MFKWPDLRSVLEDIPWAVIGGVATRRYMPERLTKDLDILIQKKDAQEIHERMIKAEFNFLQPLSVGGSMWRSLEGVEIDIIEADEEWTPDALAKARENPDKQGLPILPFPYFILLKFQSGRVQDIADITRMLGLADNEQREETLSLFDKFDPESIDDLEQLINLGKMEIEEQ